MSEYDEIIRSAITKMSCDFLNELKKYDATDEKLHSDHSLGFHVNSKKNT